MQEKSYDWKQRACGPNSPKGEKDGDDDDDDDDDECIGLII